jgi:hypothetical protein
LANVDVSATDAFYVAGSTLKQKATEKAIEKVLLGVGHKYLAQLDIEDVKVNKKDHALNKDGKVAPWIDFQAVAEEIEEENEQTSEALNSAVPSSLSTKMAEQETSKSSSLCRGKNRRNRSQCLGDDGTMTTSSSGAVKPTRPPQSWRNIAFMKASM